MLVVAVGVVLLTAFRDSHAMFELFVATLPTKVLHNHGSRDVSC